MAVIGIISCEILELELAAVLAEDPAIGRINVLENRHSARLIAMLGALPHIDLQCLPHIHAYRPEPGERIELLIRVLALGLHRKRQLLRDALRRAADEFAPHVAALMLGYGLCGNALDDPHAVLDVDLPIFQPLDQGRPVDDCVALCLGGRATYAAELHACPGTFFLTPGWSNHWPRMFDTRSGELAQAGRKRLLAGYQRGLLVLTPAFAEAAMRQRGRTFCQATGLRLEERRGSMALLAAAWSRARNSLEAPTASAQQGGNDANDRAH